MTTVTAGSSTPLLPYQQRWSTLYRDFNRALYANEPFDAFLWVFRLISGISDYVYHWTGLARVYPPAIPVLALTLVLLCVYSYFAHLRAHLRETQGWCADSGDGVCRTDTLHTSFVTYLAVMIVWNHLSTTFRSPGVVVAVPSNRPTAEAGSVPSQPLNGSENQNHAAADTGDRSDSQHVHRHHDALNWTCGAGQGGTLGINVRCDVEAEQARVALYGPPNESTFTYCSTCDHWRPPRCHHSSKCNRCVLQLDHYCPWGNNCIGYNNYREFLLTVLYITIGCLYGFNMLWREFYTGMKGYIDQYGWWESIVGGEHQTGFLDLPPPLTMLKTALFTKEGLPPTVIIRLIFPLLFGSGLTLGAFLGFHVMYVATGRTTLEHKILLHHMLEEATEKALHKSRNSTGVPTSHAVTTEKRPVSPYKQDSFYKNVQQALGRNLWLCLVPVSVTPLPPYLPERMTDKTD